MMFCHVGGRFKKEVVLDGQSYLLLIRDEGGLPEVQVVNHCLFLIIIIGIGCWHFLEKYTLTSNLKIYENLRKRMLDLHSLG